MNGAFVCIHGHFYQPPRENAWLEAIEVQDSAAPYHDWNERVTAESYGPNARARILDAKGTIQRIVNNYSRISFNFGPTLLSWMAQKAPEVYQAVLNADRESAARFSGHGFAIAQAYNHVIMPLANERDQRTQVLWGIADFQHRFGRSPEGMWLPETAVDIKTLEVLASAGISFTILAPHQAARIRPLSGGVWTDVTDTTLDATRPYRVRLPSGRTLALFFYDGPIARAVAFERVLESGAELASRLSDMALAGDGPRLSHIASDGETYGHHHRFGDMALASALERLEDSEDVRLTNYGEYLEAHPPLWEVEIAEDTSWSCAHGLSRWQEDCGCNSGSHPDWAQTWRAPLRQALDWLRDELGPIFEREAIGLLRESWAARDAYIEVVLDRSEASIQSFFSEQAEHPLASDEQSKALRLLEMQRSAMLMFTSCGWFFDDLAGIETVQVLEYAGRALQLARDSAAVDLEPEFLNRLALARSNRPEEGDGRQVFNRHVVPARVDLQRAVAHYAVTSLFSATEESGPAYSYRIRRRDMFVAAAGRTRLAVGLVDVSSTVTFEAATSSFAAVHLGDQNIAGGVQSFTSMDDYALMQHEVVEAFGRADLTEVIRTIDSHFSGSTFSLRSLFRDEQRRILRQVLSPALNEAEATYRQLYEEQVPLMRFLSSVGYPLPNRFRYAAEIAVNLQLRRVLAEPQLDASQVRSLIEEAHAVGVEIDKAGLGFVLQGRIQRLAERFQRNSADSDAARSLLQAVELARDTGLHVDLWRAQNTFYDVLVADQLATRPPDRAPADLEDRLELLLDLSGALGVQLSWKAQS